VFSGTLEPSTRYYWKVLAMGSDGVTEMMGDVRAFTTGTDGAPAAFDVIQPNGDVSVRAVLNWDEAPGRRFFRITVFDQDDSVVLEREMISVPGFIFCPVILFPGKSYRAEIEAYNDGYVTPAQNAIHFTVEDRPAAPLLRAAVPHADGYLSVYFNDYYEQHGYYVRAGPVLIYTDAAERVLLSNLPAGIHEVSVVAVSENFAESGVLNTITLDWKGMTSPSAIDAMLYASAMPDGMPVPIRADCEDETTVRISADVLNAVIERGFIFSFKDGTLTLPAGVEWEAGEYEFTLKRSHTHIFTEELINIMERGGYAGSYYLRVRLNSEDFELPNGSGLSVSVDDWALKSLENITLSGNEGNYRTGHYALTGERISVQAEIPRTDDKPESEPNVTDTAEANGVHEELPATEAPINASQASSRGLLWLAAGIAMFAALCAGIIILTKKYKRGKFN
jgi:hypothetical protein